VSNSVRSLGSGRGVDASARTGIGARPDAAAGKSEFAAAMNSAIGAAAGSDAAHREGADAQDAGKPGLPARHAAASDGLGRAVPGETDQPTSPPIAAETVAVLGGETASSIGTSIEPRDRIAVTPPPRGKTGITPAIDRSGGGTAKAHAGKGRRDLMPSADGNVNGAGLAVSPLATPISLATLPAGDRGMTARGKSPAVPHMAAGTTPAQGSLAGIASGVTDSISGAGYPISGMVQPRQEPTALARAPAAIEMAPRSNVVVGRSDGASTAGPVASRPVIGEVQATPPMLRNLGAAGRVVVPPEAARDPMQDSVVAAPSPTISAPIPASATPPPIRIVALASPAPPLVNAAPDAIDATAPRAATAVPEPVAAPPAGLKSITADAIVRSLSPPIVRAPGPADAPTPDRTAAAATPSAASRNDATAQSSPRVAAISTPTAKPQGTPARGPSPYSPAAIGASDDTVEDNSSASFMLPITPPDGGAMAANPAERMLPITATAISAGPAIVATGAPSQPALATGDLTGANPPGTPVAGADPRAPDLNIAVAPSANQGTAPPAAAGAAPPTVIVMPRPAAATTPQLAANPPAIGATTAAPAAAPSSPPAVAATAPAGPGATLGNALAGHVMSLISTGRQEATLQLQPPQLGDMTVRIAVQGRDVSAWFGTAQPQVQAAVTQALGQLRLDLAGAGLNLAGAWVGADASGTQRQAFEGSTGAARRPGFAAPTIEHAASDTADRPNRASGVNIYV
jgi:flagellar hook-length control protein FliK